MIEIISIEETFDTRKNEKVEVEAPKEAKVNVVNQPLDLKKCNITLPEQKDVSFRLPGGRSMTRQSPAGGIVSKFSKPSTSFNHRFKDSSTGSRSPVVNQPRNNEQDLVSISENQSFASMMTFNLLESKLGPERKSRRVRPSIELPKYAQQKQTRPEMPLPTIDGMMNFSLPPAMKPTIQEVQFQEIKRQHNLLSPSYYNPMLHSIDTGCNAYWDTFRN